MTNMRGLQIRDTYGPLFGVDQMCDCDFAGDIKVGDEVSLETEDGSAHFRVSLIETYRDDDGVVLDYFGVGLQGPDADLIMAGDTLEHQPELHVNKASAFA